MRSIRNRLGRGLYVRPGVGGNDDAMTVRMQKENYMINLLRFIILSDV